MNLSWQILPFNQLTTTLLYEILQFRAEVFVVEQDCPYLDPDGKDFLSYHVLGFEDDTLVAYARLVKPGVSYAEWAIGRVVVRKTHRAKGLGYMVMKTAMGYLKREQGTETVRLSAQSHLKDFYSSLGFVDTGKAYLEDGIPHIEMLAKKKAAPKGDPH